MPVGAVTQIRYSPQRDQQQRQGEQKEHPFQVMFQMQLKEAPMEENQSFQLYCWKEKQHFMNESIADE